MQNALHRELQWAAARRVPERDDVHVACPGEGCPRGMAARLQHRAKPHSSIGWLTLDAYAARFFTGQAGPRRCAHHGLRAMAPCHRSRRRGVQPPDSTWSRLDKSWGQRQRREADGGPIRWSFIGKPRSCRSWKRRPGSAPSPCSTSCADAIQTSTPTPAARWNGASTPTEREVMFRQQHEPGRLGQSDFSATRSSMCRVLTGSITSDWPSRASSVPTWCSAARASSPWPKDCRMRWRGALGGAPKEHRSDSLSAAFRNRAAEARAALNWSAPVPLTPQHRKQLARHCDNLFVRDE